MNTSNKILWCKKCLSMSTRPRITYDSNGVCNACLWSIKKTTIDWEQRENFLIDLLEKNKSNDGNFDCIVPVSGGKDGSYVTHQLKHKYKMNPLCVTITPHTETELGKNNLNAFVKSNVNHMSINIDYQTLRNINKTGFIEIGFPYYGWLIAINSAPAIIAKNFNIDLIFYGEDGEVEYGGVSKSMDEAIFNIDYQKKIYLEGGYDRVIDKALVDKKNLYFLKFPKSSSIKLTHWSYYENWNPYRNYITAKDNYGLKESIDTNQGTFTNFAQNDQAIYALHTHLMFLKFGFGRATQDASIEIRRGAMSREQAINLVELYDGHFPENYLEIYLDYYQMNKIEFYNVLKKWTNKELFEVKNDIWIRNFKIS